MKTLVAYFSYSGNTKKLAAETASKENADLTEIRYIKRPGLFSAFLRECPKAKHLKPSPMQPLDVDLNAYEKIIIMSPVWARYPVPVINSFIALLPPGKDVEVILVSSTGTDTAKEQVESAITGKGCRLVKYRNVNKLDIK